MGSFGLVGISSIVQSQNFTCYEIIESNTGITNLYRDILDEKACELKTYLTSQGLTDFKIVGRDFYPPMLYVKSFHKSVFNELYNKSVEELEVDVINYPSYILITKEHHENGDIFYRIALKLPTEAPFDDITPLEEAAIKGQILEAINSKAGSGAAASTKNSEAEKNGLAKLLLIFQAIKNGTFSVDLAESLKEAGFEKIDFGNSLFSLDIDPCEDTFIDENIWHV